jgi:hypothetical protein
MSSMQDSVKMLLLGLDIDDGRRAGPGYVKVGSRHLTSSR